MANQLRMAVVETIISLRRRGWSRRRIAEELGINRRRWRGIWVRLRMSQNQPARPPARTDRRRSQNQPARPPARAMVRAVQKRPARQVHASRGGD
jgi:hypothetical protein